MRNEKTHRPSAWLFLAKTLEEFFVFFLLTAFIVTCCTMLFVSTVSDSLGVPLTQENLGLAAKITFLNVLLLSVIFTVIDRLRRHFTVERPLSEIQSTAAEIASGNFSARVSFPEVFIGEGFREVSDMLNRMAMELAGIETLRTGFLADVSHEIKTPLSAIQNYAALLAEKGLSEEKRIEYAEAVRSSVSRLSSLISNILRLNKLENQQIPQNRRVYDIGEQICEELLLFESLWEKKHIEIEPELSEGILVYADREMLSIVFCNLFSNALKFTPNGGRVSVRLTADEDRLFFEVSDTGCGISPEVGKHIFEKFYQGDSSHATEGNGLGLALVHRIIDISGGEISVKSEIGKGSTFTVSLQRYLHGENERDL